MITPTFGRRLQPFGAAAPKAATAPKRGLPPKRAAATPPANGGAGQPGSALPPRLPAAARNVKPRTAPPAQLPTIAESDGDLPAADLPMMSSLLDDALQQQAVPVPAATPAAGPPSAPVLKSTPARPSFAKAPSKHPAAAAKQPGTDHSGCLLGKTLWDDSSLVHVMHPCEIKPQLTRLSSRQFTMRLDS